MKKQPTSVQILLIGELIVNLPVTIIIIGSALIMMKLGLGWNPSLIVGAMIGWFAWSKLLDQWISWAFGKGVDPNTLYRLGKIGLINFYRYKIFDFKNRERIVTSKTNPTEQEKGSSK